MDTEDFDQRESEPEAQDSAARPTRRRFIITSVAVVAAAAVAGVVAVGSRLLEAIPGLPALPEVSMPYLGDFKINTVESETPEFDEATWRMTVDGLVQEEMALGWSDFLALPSVTQTHDFRCVEGWSVRDLDWEGVQVSEVIKRARPNDKAKYVVFHSSGGVYTDSLSLADAKDERALLAFKMNGEPIEVRQGRPVRLIVPWMYGYKGPKWVERLEFVAEPHNGYWEQRGYPADADLPT